MPLACNYIGLLMANLLIGLGNGCTEAACNPMIADAYEGNRMSKMLNRFHMWFPGGIAIGSLLSGFMTDSGIIGQNQVWLLLIPTLIYAYLFFGQAWPKAKVQEAATLSGNLKSMVTPLFIFIAICMALTAISEFGPNQWVGLILAKSGAQPTLILALTASQGGLITSMWFLGFPISMIVGGLVYHTVGGKRIMQFAFFAHATGMAAIVFALGIAYFWPNMIGLVATKVPKSGALGMSIIGAVGMFSSSIFQRIIGGWIDSDRAAASAQGLTGDELELVAGQATLGTMVLFPGILIVLFTILYFWMKNRKAQPSIA